MTTEKQEKYILRLAKEAGVEIKVSLASLTNKQASDLIKDLLQRIADIRVMSN